MTESERFREQAERCLRLAKTSDREVADSLNALAAEYLDAAQRLERLAATQIVPSAAPARPIQQQQQIQPKKGE
jgi:hypothetical protein